jgi:4-aminobutyrate aminotransferase/(S)-3-amino-2-methylpropionate transaminase
LIEKWGKKNRPVVGVVIEPMQAEGGDNFASAEFFQGLQDICLKVIYLYCIKFSIYN